MGDIRIYLAGGVTGLTLEEANAWRIKIIELLKNTDGYYRPRCINPTDYYNYSMPSDSYTQREIMDFDFNKVRTSDLIIVNFNAPKSLGTAAELAIAYDRGIPILGLCEAGEDIYPWQKDMCLKIFGNMEALVAYVRGYFLD